MVTDLTDEEKRELGICIDLSSIVVMNLFRHEGDTTAAAVADDEGTHRLSSTSRQYLLDVSDASSLSIREEDNDQHRRLQSEIDCNNFCLGVDRPEIEVTIGAFSDLIIKYTGSDTSSCPLAFNIPLNCWMTSTVDDRSREFILSLSKELQ